MTHLTISELTIYPVKSMRAVALNLSEIEFGGLKNDRRWMVIDTNGHMVTQRQQSRLCLIQPVLSKTGIVLTAVGKFDIRIDTPDSKHNISVIVWEDTCNAYDAGDDAAQWLSEFLDIECRLVHFPQNEIRTVDQSYALKNDQTAFSDGFPILLISQASLDDLNAKLEVPVPMHRFRPNIVIGGCKAFAEDSWKQLKIGELILRIVKPCSRCVIPSIDINTGERTSEPTKTLVSYRRHDKKIFFGQNGIIDGASDGISELKKGMIVEVIE